MAMTLAIIYCMSAIVAGALNPIHLVERKGRPHAFVDSEGYEVIFHGSTAVVKGPPWYPDHTQFSKDISMSREDFEWMQKLGLNFLRLGVMWPGTEPIRGQYNETYLDQIDKVITLAAAHGVYTMLDMHQDGFSEFFCGEGFPQWAVKRNQDHWDEPLRKPFPAPFDKFENDTCFYSEAKQQGAIFPTRQACAHHTYGSGFGETTFESAQAYQAFWENWNGTGDAFAAMWAKVALRFKGRPEVVGLNLINEPFAGDLYHHPLLMLPWPSPTNADRVNLQPTYDKVNAAVRAVDEDVILFIAGVTWGDLGSGFTAAPGGHDFGNKTVVTYHFYEPPQLSAEQQVSSHILEAQRLGTGAMLTETMAITSQGTYDRHGNITDACDAHLQGWAQWQWKSFFRKAPNDENSVSQYNVWGTPKTGTGPEWDGHDPPENYINDFARTYAPRVAGSHVKMQFSAPTAEFELQYEVGRVEPDVATEIYILPSRYPGGANVSATASIGSVHVDYDGHGQWVRIHAGVGLALGARVTVKISKKVSQEVLI